jgi:hypothetical protein
MKFASCRDWHPVQYTDFHPFGPLFLHIHERMHGAMVYVLLVYLDQPSVQFLEAQFMFAEHCGEIYGNSQAPITPKYPSGRRNQQISVTLRP